MRKNRWRASVVCSVRRVHCACLMALCVLATGCSAVRQVQEPDLTVPVKTMKVEKGSLSQESVYIGQIENTESVQLVCRVSGTVEGVNVSVGDHVTKDKVLAHFDDTPAKIELDDKKTAVATAQKGYESAQKSLETSQANYNSAVTTGMNSLNAQHELADYQKAMDIQSIESDISYWSNKISEYKDSTLDDAKDDVKTYKRKKKQAKKNGDEEAYQKYKELLDSAEKNLDTAEQNLLDMEQKYDSRRLDYQTAVGVRERTNGEIYAGQQLEVLNSITVAQKNMESAAINVSSAAISVESAKNQVKSAEYQLSLYDIKTPIEGVVEDVKLENNNYYNAGSVGFVIANPDSKRAVFYVTDSIASELELGQKVEAEVNGRQYEGRISEVAVAVDETVGLFEVKAYLDNASDVASGVGVKVRTVIHQSDNMVIIPTDAVYFSDNDTYVFVYENGIAVRRPVNIDIFGETQTTITDGIEEGETLITSWSGTLHDGVAVREEKEEVK